MTIEGSPKEIADFVITVQKPTIFIPQDSNGYHYGQSKSVKNPLAKN